MTDYDDRLFPGFETPELPADLPPIVLARAHAALRTPALRPELWSRIRGSRGLRLLWAASVAALCVANLALGGWMTTNPETEPPLSTVAGLVPEPEIEQIIDLPPLRFAAGVAPGIRGALQPNSAETENPS